MTRIFLPIMTALILGACGTINGSMNQSIGVQVFYHDMQIENANCTLTNSKGTWHTKSQRSVIIRRSGSDMTIHCTKKGLPDGTLIVTASTVDGVWVNRITGGLTGSLVDAVTNADDGYPVVVTVYMGKTSLFPLPKSR
jgi:hypothetical protein